jgi:RimJ/RimL family protein N-acetyltransferase
MIPRLETERLILRDYRPEDFEAFVTIMADPEVVRYLPGGDPLSRFECWRFVASSIGHWALRGYGTWVVERKSDGAMMGRIGLIQPDGWPGLEVGWTLGKPYWGYGYATEAGEASLRYAFATQPVQEVISTIHPANLASQAVAKKLGERCGRRLELSLGGRVYPCDVWSVSRTEWLSRVGMPG